VAIRWISNSRRATQRLGFCKPLLQIAGRGRTRAEMTEDVGAVVARRVSVPFDPALKRWIEDQKGTLDVQTIDTVPNLEIQVAYLYRSRARSGWLSPKGVEEYVEVLPRKLGVVDEVFRPTEAGTIVLGSLMPPNEQTCWNELCSDVNPLELSSEQAFYFFYLILAADGDFLIPWLGRLAALFGEDTFGFGDAGNTIPSVLSAMVRAFEPVAYLASDRQQIASVESTRQRIEKEILDQEHRRGGGSRRDQIAVPRLEWMVDIGVLRRVDRDGYVYTFTDEGRAAVRALSSAYETALSHAYADTVLETTLREHYIRAAFSLMSDAAIPDDRGLDRVDIVDYLRPAFDDIDSFTGYCLLRTLVLLAAIHASRSQRTSPLEYAEAVGLLEAAYKAEPDRLHYTIDRLTTDYQVRLKPAARPT
jgi:hypothetical protein